MSEVSTNISNERKHCPMKKLLAKNNAAFTQVMYATREGRKTVLHLTDGRRLETFLPISKLTSEAPEGMLESINKGVIIAPSHVASVASNVFTMTDGAQFKGRVRLKSARLEQAAAASALPARQSWEQFAILDELPVAFCVIELVFDENGRGIDFIFRYCNREMEVLEGKRIDEMLDHSFYEVFENGDKKWLVTYADVALNGVKRVIESYSPEIGATLRICCYQPKPYFCACLLMKV